MTRVLFLSITVPLLICALSSEARVHEVYSGYTYFQSEATEALQTTLGGLGDRTESGSVTGFRFSYQSFGEEALYLSIGTQRAEGDYDVCVRMSCASLEYSRAQTSVETGWAVQGWVPFGALSWTKSQFEGYSIDTDIDIGGGTWYHFSEHTKIKFKLIGLTDSERLRVSSGIQHRLDRGFTIGTSLSFPLSSKVNGFGIQLKVGRSL